MRVSVVDLVGRPGATRRFDRTLGRDDAVSYGADVTVAGPVEIECALESVVEGILVRGDVRFPLAQPCARCLRPVAEIVAADVAELFEDPARSPEEVEEGYELDVDAIDLSALLRDTIAAARPLRVLCDPDCRGLCPTCGVDRNETDCGHVEDVTGRDARWAALERLRLSEDPSRS